MIFYEAFHRPFPSGHWLSVRRTEAIAQAMQLGIAAWEMTVCVEPKT
jgi:hypothetical protein